MLKKLFLVASVMSLAISGTVYARDINEFNYVKNLSVESELLPESENTSIGYLQGNERSSALAGALAEITNEGNGVIGVYAETTMHTPVDWAYITIYLERWYEEYGTWQIEETLEKEFLPENETDGLLTNAVLFDDIEGQPTGYYYRVRAIHELEFDDGWYEAKVTKTDGILITSEP